MRASTFIGEEVSAVFTLEFLYSGYWRTVENATVKRDVKGDWFIVGLEKWKTDGTDSVATDAVKSYRVTEAEEIKIKDVYEYEGN